MTAVTDCLDCPLRCRPLFVPMTGDELQFQRQFKRGARFVWKHLATYNQRNHCKPKYQRAYCWKQYPLVDHEIEYPVRRDERA